MKKLALSFILILLSINFVEAKKSAIDFQVTKQLIDTVKWEIINESSVRFMIEEIPSLYDTDIKCIRITIGDEVCAESHVYLNEEDKEIPYLCVTGQINKYRNKDVLVSFLSFFRKNSIIYYHLYKGVDNSKPDWRLQLTASQMREVLDFLRELNDYNHAQSEASRTTFESDTLNLSLLIDKILMRYNPKDKYKNVYKQVKKDGLILTSDAYDYFFSLVNNEQTNNLKIKYSGVNLTYCGVRKEGNKIYYYSYGFNFGHIKYDFIPQLFIARLLRDFESIGYSLHSHKTKYKGSSYSTQYSSYEQFFLTKGNDIVEVSLQHSDKYELNCSVFFYVYPQCTDKKTRENILNKRY